MIYSYQNVHSNLLFQCLVDENGDQRREIARLKQDNADLIKKVKLAQQDRHQVMVSIFISVSLLYCIFFRLCLFVKFIYN